jgi:hypothetical protein
MVNLKIINKEMINYMKTKCFGLAILGILLIVPLLRISYAQNSYVGIQNSDEFEWALSIYSENWDTYMMDDIGTTLENLIPLGDSNLTKVFNDWSVHPATPQSYWPLTDISIGMESTQQLFSPYDNTTITSTPVNATFGWIFPPFDRLLWEDTWQIVNDTHSFLRQTLNLSRSFSPYAMFSVLFIPITIDWSLLINDFLGVMDSKGGFYNNISATAQSNGYLIEIPALGFENNSVAININVKYDSRGALSYYKFSYGDKTLVSFIPGKYIPETERLPGQYIYMFIGLSVIFVVELVIYTITRKRG